MRRRRAAAAAGAVLSLVAGIVSVVMTVSSHAAPTVAESCRAIAIASAVRRAEVTGTGPTVAVIGDSYAQGRGLADPRQSWPSRLPGRVVVDGFSGSGFSDAASPCAGEGYQHRVAAALALHPSLVVLEGGLNEYDVPDSEIRSGLDKALAALAGHRVVVVGPPPAPSRAAQVPRVDRLLQRLTRRHGVPYVDASTWQLSYLPDRLHLTAAGHAAFGDRVASALRAR